MAKNLYYGGNQFRISDDEDIAAIALSIKKTLESGQETWFSVPTENGVVRIFLTRGLSIAFEESSADTPPSSEISRRAYGF